MVKMHGRSYAVSIRPLVVSSVYHVWMLGRGVGCGESP